MKTFLILLFLISTAFADKTFKISIKGEEKTLDALKVKADLQMVSSTKYCRGTYLPSPISQWECSGNECNRSYSCKLITKNFSRNTEIPKLKVESKKAGKSTGTVEMPKQEKLALDTPKPKLKKIEINLPVKKEEPPVEIKADKFEEEALALLDENDFSGEEKTVAEKLSKMDQDITYEELVEPKKITEASPYAKKEGEWKLIKTTSRQGGYKNYELEKVLDKNEQFKKKLNILGFSLGMLSMSGTDTNLSSGYFAWSPRWELSPKWAIRGEAGIQFYAEQFYDSEDVLISSNNFLISPYAAYLNYYGSFYFLEAGGGFQWWYEQDQEFNPMVGVGLGYRFPDTFFTLDRISLNYDYVMAQEDLNEFKLSLTFLF